MLQQTPVQPTFMSIRQVAQTGILPEHLLRKMQRRGLLPGLYTGRKFIVNYTLLLKMLDNLDSQIYQSINE